MTDPRQIRRVVDHVADVAKKTAVQQNPLVEVTVLSRNPDGSLNVDDGKGGCLRVAPRANVRVGQRIKLGQEPALGQQTSLPEQNFDILVPTPCPDDPRPIYPVPIPAPPLPVSEFSGVRHEIFNQLSTDAPWSDRNASGSLNATGETLAPLVKAVSAGGHFSYAVSRNFLQFNTFSLDSRNFTGATLQMTVDDLHVFPPAVRSDNDRHLIVVLSHAADFPVSTADWLKLGHDTGNIEIVGAYRILDAAGFGISDTYAIQIPLGSEDWQSAVTPEGLLKLGLIIDWDLSDTTAPPVLPSTPIWVPLCYGSAPPVSPGGTLEDFISLVVRGTGEPRLLVGSVSLPQL